MASRRGRVRWWLKWAGTMVSLILVLLFVYSTARSVMWTSRELEYQANLTLGTVSVAWRPEGWKLQNDPYPGTPGWTVGMFFGATWIWWISSGANRAWAGITLPLWIPTLLIALPTAVLWYRDRQNVREQCRRVIGWLRPVRRKRMTLWLVLVCSFIHAVLAVLAIILTVEIHDFFKPHVTEPGPRPVDTFMYWAVRCIFWATPLWGAFWAWLYVRTLNRLGQRGERNRCFECGYDLRGNVSGVCPECGRRVEQKAARAAGD